jgi:hypothetical protein
MLVRLLTDKIHEVLVEAAMPEAPGQYRQARVTDAAAESRERFQARRL